MNLNNEKKMETEPYYQLVINLHYLEYLDEILQFLVKIRGRDVVVFDTEGIKSVVSHQAHSVLNKITFLLSDQHVHKIIMGIYHENKKEEIYEFLKSLGKNSENRPASFYFIKLDLYCYHKGLVGKQF